MILVLSHAWSSPFTTRSGFARDNADLIAEAASRQLITTFDIPRNTWGRTWRITATGLDILEEQHNHEHRIEPQ